MDGRPTYIYKIIDRKTNNCYIGKTMDVKHRIRQHRYSFRHKKQMCSSSIILKNNDWYYEIIEIADNPIEREKYFIKNTPNCINERMVCEDPYKNKQEYMKEYNKKRYLWQVSWGDAVSNKRYGSPNNLLLIDPNLFLE